MTATALGHVQILLDELDRYPQDRTEIVFELAAECARVGDDNAALEWLGTLVAAGGLDGALARVEIASVHFSSGRDDLAWAELDAIKATRPRDPSPYAMAAELLSEHGEQTAALLWFTMAASRFTGDELAAAVGEDGWITPAYTVLWQRSQLRERLGYVPDDLDAGLLPPPFQRESFPSVEETLADGVPVAAQRLRILVWPEPQFVLAKQTWPKLMDEAVSHVEYRQRLESQLREARATSSVRIELIAADVELLQNYADRRGGSVLEAPVRRGYLDEQAGLGRSLAWPPGRNARCWCGSDVKYKKCCGR